MSKKDISPLIGLGVAVVFSVFVRASLSSEESLESVEVKECILYDNYKSSSVEGAEIKECILYNDYTPFSVKEVQYRAFIDCVRRWGVRGGCGP